MAAVNLNDRSFTAPGRSSACDCMAFAGRLRVHPAGDPADGIGFSLRSNVSDASETHRREAAQSRCRLAQTAYRQRYV